MRVYSSYPTDDLSVSQFRRRDPPRRLGVAKFSTFRRPVASAPIRKFRDAEFEQGRVSGLMAVVRWSRYSNNEPRDISDRGSSLPLLRGVLLPPAGIFVLVSWKIALLVRFTARCKPTNGWNTLAFRSTLRSDLTIYKLTSVHKFAE